MVSPILLRFKALCAATVIAGELFVRSIKPHLKKIKKEGTIKKIIVPDFKLGNSQL